MAEVLFRRINRYKTLETGIKSKKNKGDNFGNESFLPFRSLTY